MILKLRNNRYFKAFTLFMGINLLSMYFTPSAYALTGGPSQPEVQSFEPIGTTDMVDVFSGDFTYNIPLIDVGGYPINISYHSGVTMDQEASWVGLGWNINPGAIVRNKRGLPDDFKGEKIIKENYIKPNKTWTVTPGIGFELFGIEKFSKKKELTANLNLSLPIRYNNYKGVGISVGATLGLGVDFKQNQSADHFFQGILPSANLGLQTGPDGVAISPSLSLKKQVSDDGVNLSIGASTTYSSRNGLTGVSMNYSVSENYVYKPKNIKSTQSLGGGVSISLGQSTHTPSIQTPMKTFAISASFKLSGLAFMGEHTSFNLSGSYTENSLLETNDKKPAYGYLYSHEAAFNDEVLLDFNREKQVPFSEYGNLPLTNFTYDMYSITGQGIGGSFRPFRSDIGHVHDNKSIDRSTSSSLGLELGMGNTTHGGMDIGFNQVDGISGDWYYSLDFLTFKKDHQNGYEDYEPYYFKQMGEKSVDNDPLNGAWIESDELISPEIVMITAKNHNLSDKYNIYNKNNVKTQTKNYSSSNQRNSRRARTLSILPLKTEEVRKIVPSNQQAIYSGKGHSIGTYVVTKPDGTRYVYGMPLYNLVEKEVVFNVSENGYTADCSTGLIKYNPTRDPKSENGNGVDEYYSKTITPQYAHSYMLTEVLSSDYVDVDFNGPTLNDLGTYVKFSYADSVAISSYKWRIPYKKIWQTLIKV